MWTEVKEKKVKQQLREVFGRRGGVVGLLRGVPVVTTGATSYMTSQESTVE